MGLQLLGKLGRSLTSQGVLKTSQRVKGHLKSRYVEYRDDKRFDNKHGVETSKIEHEYIRHMKSPFARFAGFYEATKWRHFSVMMKATPIAHRDYVFLDAGCGKGRVLMFASRFAFKRIIGVEVSDFLVEIAERNIEVFQRKIRTRAQIDVRCQDIASFDLPKSNLLIYLYNPFKGKLMELFIEKIKRFVEEHDYHVYIQYRNALCAKMFEAQPWLEKIAEDYAYAIYRSHQAQNSAEGSGLDA